MMSTLLGLVEPTKPTSAGMDKVGCGNGMVSFVTILLILLYIGVVSCVFIFSFNMVRGYQTLFLLV